MFIKSDSAGLSITDKELKKITGIKDLKRLFSPEELKKLAGKDPKEYLPADSDIIIRPSVTQAISHDSEWQHVFFKKIAGNINTDRNHSIGCFSSVILTLILLVALKLFWDIDVIAFIPITLLGIPLIYFGMRIGSKYLLPQHSADSVKNSVIEYVTSLKPTLLGSLLDEVDRYNQTAQELVSHIQVIDQLAKAGNPVTIKDRDKIIGAFKNMRSDLIRALKTEKIFRDNPDFNPERFSIDFMPFTTLEFDEQAKDYERLVNEAIEIGSRVQEEMKSLSEIL
jgi:hypothetical protein